MTPARTENPVMLGFKPGIHAVPQTPAAPGEHAIRHHTQ